MPLDHLLAASLVAFAPAEPSQPAFLSTRLEVNASAIGEQGSGESVSMWESLITALLTDEFRAYRVPIITLEEAATFKATLAWDGDRHRNDVKIEVEVTAVGQPAQSRSFVCRDCEFAVGAAARIIEELPSLVPLLERAPALAPAPAAEPREPGPDAPQQQRDRPRALSALGWSGVALGAVGIGLVGGGAVLLARTESSVEPDASGDRPITTSYPQRTEGIVLTAVGAASVAAGVAMVTYDALRLKKRNRAHAVLRPTFTIPGLALCGSF